MNTNGPGKNFLLSTLFLAAALLLSPVVSSAQTDGTTLTGTKLAASSDLSSAIEVAVGDGPTGIAFDGASIWVTNQFSNSVMKVANNGTVLGRYATGKNPIGVASDGASVWVANNADDSVTKFSIDGVRLGTFAAGNGPQAVLITGKYIWVAYGKQTG